MKIKIVIFFVFALSVKTIFSQVNLGNVYDRNEKLCLNGKWQIIVDQYDYGRSRWVAIWEDKKPQGKTDFYEYSFDGGPVVDVPGDFNSQISQLYYYEGTVWYKKTFDISKKADKRYFICFGAVNYLSEIYLNKNFVGKHEGGFTSFQFEVTDLLKDGENMLIVCVNNKRSKDNIPALDIDWFNYGGITRDVFLVETPESFIKDNFIQLKKSQVNVVKGWIQLQGSKLNQNIRISIPEAKIEQKLKTDDKGFAEFEFTAKLVLWSPENPKLYKVNIISETDTINELIGFRTIETKGTDIILNGKPIFLKGINIHEEIPQRRSRAYNETDAIMLLSWAKELGCNFVRLAHYPHNEYMVRTAEKMGLMIWSEIPVYWGIDFANPIMQDKLNFMLEEMVMRDKNRCGIIIWSLSNETSPSEARNKCLKNMAEFCRSIDPTRLLSSALSNIKYSQNKVIINDTIVKHLDIIAVNEYLGWYRPWPSKPEEVIWESEFNKPLIISEFGGEALYGNHGPDDIASSWSEEFQEKLYKEQIRMFTTIPFLRGTCPWILADFNSPRRLHPVFQDGWNRKGLISDKGFKKKAWFIMKEYYTNKN
jgi:beta-glucuronidase